MKILTVQDIQRSLAEKQTRQFETFEKILNLCFKQIGKTVTLNRNVCLFEVPEFMLGHPTYSLERCVVYLFEKVRQNGFNVVFFFPRILQISWNAEVDNTKKILGNPVQYLQPLEAPIKSLEFLDTSKQPDNKQKFKSITEFKPSGKFTLNLT